MHFGMPTLIELDKLDKCAALCRKLGLQFIEINMNLPEYQLDKIDVLKFKEIANKYSIYYTLHLDENLNAFDFNAYVAEAYQNTVLSSIKIAKSLDIPILNMHMAKGVYFTLPDRKVYLFDKYRDLYLQNLTAFRKITDETIGGSNIKLCVENGGAYQDFQKEGVDLLLQSTSFSLTYDIGHAACNQAEMDKFISKHNNRLAHMHIHDAVQVNKSDHLPLGMGGLDLPKYFEMAAFNNCRVVLETKTVEGLRQSVEWAKEKRYF